MFAGISSVPAAPQSRITQLDEEDAHGFDDAARVEDAAQFDSLAEGLNAGPVDEGLLAVMGALSRRRAQLEPAAWRQFARDSDALLKLKALLRHEPLARRAQERPRGQAWDAISTDLACGIVGVPAETDARAAQCHAVLRAGALCRSIRRRRELAAAFLDDVCTDHHFPRMLALGCGHARELALSRLYALGRVGDFCAVDGDVECLRLLERAHRQRVRTIPTDPLKFVAAGPLQGLFHGIYSLVLAESLDDAAFEAHLPAVLRLLRPGCRLLLVSAPPTLTELAYVEAMMDWWPVCRTAGDLASLIESIARRAGLRVECTPEQESELGWVKARRTA